MTLFEQGDFTLHSGGKSKYRINCDRLADEDIALVAERLAELLPPFSSVEGIPTGGLRLAEAMKRYYATGPGVHVIVDDVWTTGASMIAARDAYTGPEPVFGAVIFRRGLTGSCPDWVYPFADIDI